MKSAASALMMTVILVGASILAINVRPVKALETIYIRADGSVDPPTELISTVDNITYTLTGNITSEAGGIVIERNKVTLDGAGYAIRGSGGWEGVVSERSNLTLRNLEIQSFTYGIFLVGSANCSICWNRVAANEYGIYLGTGCSCNSIVGNSVTANSYCGIELYKSGNNTLSGNTVKGNYHGIYIYNNCSNNRVVGNNITENDVAGLESLYHNSNNSICSNNVTGNMRGIDAGESPNTYVSGNNVTANQEAGIAVSLSPGSSVVGNTVRANTGPGVVLGRCPNSSVNSNNVTANGNGGVMLDYCSNCTVARNLIANNLLGIVLLNNCTSNNVVENSVTASTVYGIWLYYYTAGNFIYHNTFMNNVQQTESTTLGYSNVWDDGYPSGGNYWSDSVGIDVKCGPGQDQPGGDGIDDASYVIDSYSADRFPLLRSWEPANLENYNVSKGSQTYHVCVNTNVTVVSFVEAPGSVKLSVAGETGSTGYVRIIQPVGLNATNIKVFLNSTKLTFPSDDPPRSISTNGTHYLIYLTVTFNSAYELLITFPLGGDVDYDGDVDIFDIVTIANAYGSVEGQLKYSAHCDIDHDADVDIFDLVKGAINYGKHW